MLKGKKLQFGDTIGFIAPSGVIREEGAIERAGEAAERMGFKVKFGASSHGHYGYLAGDDEARAADVNAMFRDDTVDAIVCLRGGYGTMRILDRIDYDLVRANPKIFMGFSDITALHIAMLEKSGLVTFHGPMGASNWADGLEEFTQAQMYRALMADAPLGDIPNPPEYPRATVTPGTAEGQLVGGNLSLICGLLGTPWELDTRGRILFIEEIGEHTYCVDRMLTQLRLAGKFDGCAGIVFGNFNGCNVEYEQFGCTLEEIIRDVTAPCGKPIFTGLRCGHCRPNLTLPFGVNARMDADKCTLEALESAVR